MNRKIFITLIALCGLLTILPFSGKSFDIDAYEYSDNNYYPMACSVYEVSEISEGGFNSVSCHSDFNEAKNIMKTNQNYIVRYAYSKSPTKIVAMNSGVVSIYPGRTGDNLAYIYQNMDVRDNFWKQTYCGEHTEAYYLDTPTMQSNYYPYGAVKIMLRGFEGYMSILNVDLIPTQFIENGWKLWLGGNNQKYFEQPYDAIIDQDYYMLVNDGKYTSMKYTYNYTYSKVHSLCTSHSYLVDNGKNYLDAGMKANVRYYSPDGCNFYSDKRLKNHVATVYNYYQFLPLRTTTNIPGNVLDSFMNSKNSSGVMAGQGQTFIDCQNKYGVNALMVYSMAIHESGYGSSGFAEGIYNLFGWGAYDSDPSQAEEYSSIKENIKKQMGENLRYYMDYSHSYYHGTCIGNKGTGFNVLYASDADWSMKICSYAYEIDKYANGYNGNLSDYNSYTIGVVNSWDPNIYKNSTGGSVLYTGRFGKNYQKDLTVVVLGEKDGRYKIQSTNNVVDGEILHKSGCFKYDWNTSVGYIDKQYVTVLNNKTVNTKKDATYTPIVAIDDISKTSDSFVIKGIGIIQGIDLDKQNINKNEIVFFDANTDQEVYSIVANNVDSNGFSLNDGYNYQYGGFEATITLPNANLTGDSYYLKLRTTVSGKTCDNVLRSSSTNFRTNYIKVNDITYEMNCNNSYNFRVELDKIDSPLDYSEINKPSSRSSLVGFDSIEIDENGDMEILGNGLIYYLDYVDTNQIEYSVYLVKNKTEFLKLETTLRDDETDYQKALNSSYKYENVSFIASTKNLDKNLFDLEGEYQLILRIKNGNYIDICEFNNRGQKIFNSPTDGNVNVSLNTSNVRKRLVLNVTKIESGE